jgi:hypothetical protein
VNQTDPDLRDRIADALLTTRRADYADLGVKANHREHRFDARCALCTYDVDALADAVLAVLPAPDQRAAEPEAETPLEKRLRFSERRNDDLRAECKRRGKRVLEQSEQIIALERQLDEVRHQLGAEILRAGQAEAELRRLAGEAQQDVSPAYARLQAAAAKANADAAAHAMRGMRAVFQLARRYDGEAIPAAEVLDALGLDENANTVEARQGPTQDGTDRPDPDCERCDGSGLDPDRYTKQWDGDGNLRGYRHEPCSECLPDDAVARSGQPGTDPEAEFGVDGCTCVPFTRQTNPPRYLNRPTDTVDMISGWERGRDCPHHRTATPPA